MHTVKSIEFSDYKTFSKFVISSRTKNVLVGPNNAGKSTVLDAFRIAFDALRYCSRRNAVLKSQETDSVCSTWIIPASIFQNDLQHCIHNFGDGRARVAIKLTNGNTFNILIPSDGSVECYLKADLPPRKSTNFLRDQFPLHLVIVPTLSPLEQNEELVQQETVERNRYSRLASRNFRNFWLHKSDSEFEEFSDLVEVGWPGIRLQKPVIDRGPSKAYVRMFFRDGPNVREVQWAGFGFQVWMQTMMHLTAANHSSTLILDEPDIYLHPDLQHRLMRLIGQRVGQYFVATHSTEIINDVEPGEVLIVRPEARSARRIQGDLGYADVYAAIGSSENAQFARLAKTKKVLYFEGNDARILSKISKKLAAMDFIENSTVTLMKTDGFSNWHRVTTSSWVFENFFGFEIPVAAIFDRDYRCDEEVDSFLSKVNDGDTMCKVLPVKEIENLLLVPDAIKDVVAKFSKGPLEKNWREDIEKLIADSIEDERSRALSARIGARIDYDVSKGAKDIPTISAEEEKKFSSNWANLAFRQKVVPGKRVFSTICAKVQDKYKVSLSPSRVIDSMTVADVDPQLFEILSHIKKHLDV